MSFRGPIGPPGPRGPQGFVGPTGPSAGGTGATPFRFEPDGADNTLIIPRNNAGNTMNGTSNILNSGILSGNTNTIISNNVGNINDVVIVSGNNHYISSQYTNSTINNSCIVSGFCNRLILQNTGGNMENCLISGGTGNFIINAYYGFQTGNILNSSIHNGDSNRIIVYNSGFLATSVILNGESNKINCSVGDIQRCGIICGLTNSIETAYTNSKINNSSILNGDYNRIISSDNSKSYNNHISGKNNLLSCIDGSKIYQSEISSGFGHNIFADNTSEIFNCSIFGGSTGTITTNNSSIYNSFINGGSKNTIETTNNGKIYNSGVVFGNNNKIKSTTSNNLIKNSFIIGGTGNYLNTDFLHDTCIISGRENVINGFGNYSCGIFAGRFNTISASGTTILDDNVILGGRRNKIISSSSCDLNSIIAGSDNYISAADFSSIIACDSCQITNPDPKNILIAAAKDCKAYGGFGGINQFAIIGGDGLTAGNSFNKPGIFTNYLWHKGINMISDERQKRNIKKLSEIDIDPILSLKKIEPISFEWNTQEKYNDFREYGFSAQNCYSVLPWLSNKKNKKVIYLNKIVKNNGEIVYHDYNDPSKIFVPDTTKIYENDKGYYTIIENDTNDTFGIKPNSIQALSILAQKKMIEEIENLKDELAEVKNRLAQLEN